MGACESVETHLSCTKDGDKAFHSNNLDEAIASYSRAIELNPNYYLAFYGRAQALARQMRFDEAHCDAEAALAIHPTFHLARFLKATCYDCTEDYDLAVMERSRIPRPTLHRLEQDKQKTLQGRGSLVTSFSAVSNDYEEEETEWRSELVKQQNRYNYIHGRRGQYVVRPYVRTAATRHHAEAERRRARLDTLIAEAH